MSRSDAQFHRRGFLAGGLVGLGALGSSSAVSAKLSKAAAQSHAPGIGASRFHGNAPLLPSLATGMDEAPALMQSLAVEFAPLAAQLRTQKTYWLAFNGWITDRLSGPIMDGKVDIQSLRTYTWAAYASAYWGGLELRQNWGMPPVIDRLKIKIAPPFADVQQGLAASIAPRLAALAAGGEQCLQILPTLLHEDAPTGAIKSTAYNAGCQVMLTEDPPVGQRRPGRAPRPSAVRINPRDFMRADYDLPTPLYLKVWRSAFERAVTSNPQAYEKIIIGSPGQKSLRDIWTEGVGYGNTTWGGNASDAWSDAYFDDSLHWSTVVNLGLEAVSLAAFVALINSDEVAARRAVMGNTLFTGMAAGWLIGLLNIAGRLPSRA